MSSPRETLSQPWLCFIVKEWSVFFVSSLGGGGGVLTPGTAQTTTK
jgi:hypothetical protein